MKYNQYFQHCAPALQKWKFCKSSLTFEEKIIISAWASIAEHLPAKLFHMRKIDSSSIKLWYYLFRRTTYVHPNLHVFFVVSLTRVPRWINM